MILETNTTERKQLAHALAVHLGTDAVYLGPPSFAYRVGTITIERDGKLVGEDLEPLKPFLVDEGFLDEDEDFFASYEQAETEPTTLQGQEEPEHIEEPTTDSEASEEPQDGPATTDEQTDDDPTASQEEPADAEEPSTDSEATPDFLEVGFPAAA